MASDPSADRRDVVVDSNVLLDVLTEDPAWFAWSSTRLAELADDAPLVINPIIYAEVSIRFDRIETSMTPSRPNFSVATPCRGKPHSWLARRLSGTAGAAAGDGRRSPTSTSGLTPPCAAGGS